MIARSVLVRPAPLRPSSVTTSPSSNLEVDAVQHVRLAVPAVQPADLEKGDGHAQWLPASSASAVPMYASITAGFLETSA